MRPTDWGAPGEAGALWLLLSTGICGDCGWVKPSAFGTYCFDVACGSGSVLARGGAGPLAWRSGRPRAPPPREGVVERRAGRVGGRAGHHGGAWCPAPVAGVSGHGADGGGSRPLRPGAGRHLSQDCAAQGPDGGQRAVPHLSVARMAGSTVGGVVIAVAGVYYVYPSDESGHGQRSTRMTEEPGEAWRWIRQRPVLLVMSSIGLVSNIVVGPANAVAPRLIHPSFHAPATALRIFGAASGAGIIVGGVAIGMLTLKRLGLSMAMALKGLGLALTALSAPRWSNPSSPEAAWPRQLGCRHDGRAGHSHHLRSRRRDGGCQ